LKDIYLTLSDEEYAQFERVKKFLGIKSNYALAKQSVTAYCQKIAESEEFIKVNVEVEKTSKPYKINDVLQRLKEG
jgi:hypothetical protein